MSILPDDGDSPLRLRDEPPPRPGAAHGIDGERSVRAVQAALAVLGYGVRLQDEVAALGPDRSLQAVRAALAVLGPVTGDAA